MKIEEKSRSNESYNNETHANDNERESLTIPKTGQRKQISSLKEMTD